MKPLVVVALVAAVFLAAPATAGAAVPDSDIITLYRSSIFDQHMRIHVATFDAADGRDYNSVNCFTAAHDFQVTVPNPPPAGMYSVIYWCEPGRFRQ